MLQIIGFLLCAILFALGALGYLLTNSENKNAAPLGRLLFTVSALAAVIFVLALLAQGEQIRGMLPDAVKYGLPATSGTP